MEMRPLARASSAELDGSESISGLRRRPRSILGVARPFCSFFLRARPEFVRGFFIGDPPGQIWAFDANDDSDLIVRPADDFMNRDRPWGEEPLC